jgi:predicted RNase H-like HicB family nuclease
MWRYLFRWWRGSPERLKDAFLPYGSTHERKELIWMPREYTAIMKQDGEWWIGWIEECPGVNCQERTCEELMETLRITLQEALELHRKDSMVAAGENFRVEKIAL